MKARWTSRRRPRARLIPEWGYVPSTPPTGTLAEVATQATEGLEEATQLISEIRAGRGTVGKLFTDEALYREVNAFVTAAEQVASTIDQGRGTLGTPGQRPGGGEGARGVDAEPGES